MGHTALLVVEVRDSFSREALENTKCERSFHPHVCTREPPRRITRRKKPHHIAQRGNSLHIVRSLRPPSIRPSPSAFRLPAVVSAPSFARHSSCSPSPRTWCSSHRTWDGLSPRPQYLSRVPAPWGTFQHVPAALNPTGY